MKEWQKIRVSFGPILQFARIPLSAGTPDMQLGMVVEDPSVTSVTCVRKETVHNLISEQHANIPTGFRHCEAASEQSVLR